MYEKNKTKRLTVRLSDAQYEGLEKMSSLYDVSPSEFVRQCMALTINAYKEALRGDSDEAADAVRQAEKKTRSDGEMSDKIPTFDSVVSDKRPKAKKKTTAKRSAKAAK